MWGFGFGPLGNIRTVASLVKMQRRWKTPASTLPSTICLAVKKTSIQSQPNRHMRMLICWQGATTGLVASRKPTRRCSASGVLASLERSKKKTHLEKNNSRCARMHSTSSRNSNVHTTFRLNGEAFQTPETGSWMTSLGIVSVTLPLIPKTQQPQIKKSVVVISNAQSDYNKIKLLI